MHVESLGLAPCVEDTPVEEEEEEVYEVDDAPHSIECECECEDASVDCPCVALNEDESVCVDCDCDSHEHEHEDEDAPLVATRERASTLEPCASEEATEPLPRWQPDEEASGCKRCSAKFSKWTLTFRHVSGGVVRV
jgi:hypothetical protein